MELISFAMFSVYNKLLINYLNYFFPILILYLLICDPGQTGRAGFELMLYVIVLCEVLG